MRVTVQIYPQGTAPYIHQRFLGPLIDPQSLLPPEALPKYALPEGETARKTPALVQQACPSSELNMLIQIVRGTV